MGYLTETTVFISVSSLTNKQFRNHFSNVEKLNLVQNSRFINPYLYHRSLDSLEQYSPSIPASADDDNTDSDDDDRAGGRMIDNENSVSKLSLTLKDIQDSLAKVTKYIDNDDDGEVDRSIGNVGSALGIITKAHILPFSQIPLATTIDPFALLSIH